MDRGGDRVCMVTVDDQYQEQDVCARGGFMSTLETSAIAQTAAVSDIPKTIAQAMHCEDSEYWKAAILDEITNHEEVFHVFGPPIPRTQGMKVPKALYEPNRTGRSVLF